MISFASPIEASDVNVKKYHYEKASIVLWFAYGNYLILFV